MAENFVVVVQGIKDLPDFGDMPASIKRSLVQTVNRTATWARTQSADRIADEVNFPKAYLRPSGGRLTVAKQASKSNLEAVVRGRGRPTSLARFSRGGAPNQPGVTVEVSPGKATFMRKAFLIRLKAGNADLDTRSNLGLAVRLRPGETLKNKKRVVQMKNGLYLLYGPSVDQVFDDVAEAVAPDAAEYMEREFRRIIDAELN